ncbi:MAG TPA: glycoside hydrolase family 3 C-terminal domain-containing protein [Alloacidobacterium sp.]|jgi:beta-glucosidase|nr:glycoside hydrolase family 3 C-terminal domain-containing protein [Alloacidobacterium sp.]
MTLDEKIAMVHGVTPIPVHGYVGYVPPNTRLGIPALTLADGRAAVGNGAKDITLLPAPIAAASAWDVDLMNAFGRVLGQEQWIKGTNVALAPSIDVVRIPEWGRTFESYGEDPYFNARMAVAEIKGIQSQGPIADANMYLSMNQEDNRLKEDSRVDERTLQEIYLPPFAAAIRQAHVDTIMCAYVKTNGVYSCENDYLLNKVLRKQLGFDGWVMSDWGATHSTVDSANHGLDQEMPDSRYFGDKLKAAVQSGQVSQEVLDAHVLHILLPMFQHGLFERPNPGSWSANARNPERDAFSREVAEAGTVLLKNAHGILPLRTSAHVAIIGAAGTAQPKVEGEGSSQANAPYVISPLEGIRNRLGINGNTKVSFEDGSDLGKAADIASHADVAIVFVSTEDGEGSDRPNLELPGNQDALINSVTAVNQNTIVVLDTGGPVLMPWINRVAGVIEAWYPGQEDGNAIAAILYGDVDPSAKLPLTFPRSAEAIPTSRKEQWPGVNGRSIYNEGLNVGYRWYDATNTQPLFPFGFGLSYTTFSISHLAIKPLRPSRSADAISRRFAVRVDVTNTGTREGAEVVQIYVKHPLADGEPPHQLRAFAKVELKPGETKTAIMALDPESFMTYNTPTHRWMRRAGTYEILAGTSSRDLPLAKTISIPLK